MVELFKDSGWTVGVKSSQFEDLRPIMHLMTKHYELINYKSKRVTPASEKFFTMKNLNQINIKRGMLEPLISMMNFLNIKYTLDESLTSHTPIQLTYKWYEKLINPDFSVDNKTQYEHLLPLLSYNCGLAKIATGVGKTELQLSIADSYQYMSHKNIVIIVPNSVIFNEFVTRSQKHEVFVSRTALGYSYETEHYKNEHNDGVASVGIGTWVDPTRRINIINATGFMRSNVTKNEYVQKWLSNVGLLLIDECHHLSSDSWLAATQLMGNIDYCYGFSATPDKHEHTTPTTVKSLDEWHIDLCKIVSIVGTTKTEIKGHHTKKKVKMEMLTGEWSEFEKDENDEYPDKGNHNKALSALIESKSFAKDASEYILSRDKIFFIPVHTLDSGEILRQNLTKHLGEDSVIFYNAQYITPVSDKYPDLQGVKNFINKKDTPVKVLISSTAGLEGLDIGAISGVIPIYAKNPRTTLQTLGRARDEDIIVTLVYDKNNPIVNSQSRKKQVIIKEEFKI